MKNRPIVVTPEQKAKALRDIFRNSRVRLLDTATESGAELAESPDAARCRCEGCWWPMRLIGRLPAPLYRLAIARLRK